MRAFDRKFGPDLLAGLPETPGVYLFRAESGEVLYAGKAKNIRRRLAGYRNAGRRKAHRKMRTLVREAHSVEVRLQPSETEALLAENELIRSLRPRYNVDGAFDFLYPAIGTGRDAGRLLLAFTTSPEAYEALGLRWHGVYRPRLHAREAFDALVEVLAHIGHLEPRSRTPDAPRRRGARVVALRRVPAELGAPLRSFLDGRSDAALRELFALLVESRAARRDAALVEEALRALEGFYRDVAAPLASARNAIGRRRAYVPAAERDALFIRARSGAPPASPGA